MSKVHTVVQGDHLSSIAHAHGFKDYKLIWDHPENAALKQKRQNPNVLFPGDKLVIPDKDTTPVDAPTDKRHTFTLKTTPLKLQLKLAGVYDKPLASIPCDLLLPKGPVELISDSEGKIENPIPPDVTEATLLRIRFLLTSPKRPW
jgi:hypothetical protein